MSTDKKKYDLTVTRVFEAPVEQLWKAWSDPEYVMQWWGPTGFTCPLAEMEFREGGISLVCMRAPEEFGGGDLYNTWTYRKIVPMQSIEFVNNFADKDGRKLDPSAIGLPPGVPSDVRHVIIFKAMGDPSTGLPLRGLRRASKTELTVTEYGYTSEQARDLSKQGLEQCLDKMAGMFARA